MSSESRFIDPELWDRCYDAGLRPDPRGALFIGVDASIKHDSSAVVCVKWDKDSDNLILVDHKIWQAHPGSPMDFQATIEFYSRKFQNRDTNVELALADLFQLHRSIGFLPDAGIYIEAFAQTLPNLTVATESLYNRLTNQRLKVYQADDLREHG